MKIVIDTNILISAIIGTSPIVRAVLDACRSGEVTLVLSKSLLQELGRVLHKPHLNALHRMNDRQISQYITELSSFAEMVSGATPVEVSSDPDDNIFFAIALEAGTDYIISGDKHHVLNIGSYQGIRTITPREFVETVLSKKKVA